jgi:hypothetical protein
LGLAAFVLAGAVRGVRRLELRGRVAVVAPPPASAGGELLQDRHPPDI